MKIIVLDPGHGGQDPGAVHQTLMEKDLNLNIAKRVRAYLEKEYEVKISMTREGDSTVSLEARTSLATSIKADYFCSIHHNAGGGTGFESYRNSGSTSSKERTYHEIIHREIVNVVTGKYNRRDRGIKTANFHVLRETKMPAVLLELLFMDTAQDRELLLHESFKEDISKAIGEGLAKALALPKKVTTNLYKVIAGSFKDRKNAEARLLYLQQKGITAIIVTTTLNGAPYYRVQAGAFKDRENAERYVEQIKKNGVEAFILVEETLPAAPTPPSPPSPPEPSPTPTGLSIEGSAVIEAEELDAFVKTIHSNAPLLGKYYIALGKTYGIRGDVAYAQAIHETNYFRFTGAVKANQNNFAGIGATGGDVRGAVFATPEEGVLAHIQHLYAYANKKPLPNTYPKVDPRFDLVTRGIAPTWVALNGRWAVPGTNYGQLILKIYEKILEETITIKQQEIEKMRDALVELRNSN
ncbi:Sporulation-specific N-acetylmuramoyl-L-alanine amidase [Bacillus sp. THAF10]|uniref:N-acetylmuramoyl-L-alanine amidase n=1 Tax=Bacillus sp. THAF10 TaxID=2587848 RepID=UPI001268CD0A|nr:N-acetylmuramoyl-L-alanine amidase [Bacillus sp. THAF10]QFT88404.1 Sporulation-specific N-acetylmuramoyl-L-alanine amidase [Bacillus sp. THAF10]